MIAQKEQRLFFNATGVQPSIVNTIFQLSSLFIEKPEVIQPGTVLGSLLPGIISETSFVKTKVISVASHDTASAVAAVPTSKVRFAYISCGTWSVIGTELQNAILNEIAFQKGFTNEGGINGPIRFLKNLTGLWLIQGCKKIGILKLKGFAITIYQRWLLWKTVL